MVTTGAKTAAEVARLFGLHRSSISRLLAQAMQADEYKHTSQTSHFRATGERVNASHRPK